METPIGLAQADAECGKAGRCLAFPSLDASTLPARSESLASGLNSSRPDLLINASDVSPSTVFVLWPSYTTPL